jgi:phosphoserine phosphatase RsbX
VEALAQSPLECGVAARALPGESSCGDLHVVQPVPDGVLVAVLDGLGHGREAATASETASVILKAHAEEPVIPLLMRCHAALRSTRGVVMSLASIQISHGLMTWLGIGNVQAMLLRWESKPVWLEESLLLRSGVVGIQLPPSLRAEVLTVFPGDLLVFATDGIRSNFGRELVWNVPPQGAAENILARHGLITDDALVLVARYLPDRAAARR